MFIDFGSGISKTLFIAALLFPFRCCFGIELIHKIHLKAVGFKEKIPNSGHRLFECDPSELTVVHGNIFDVDLLTKHCFTSHLVEHSNFVIFIASTAFTDRMMMDLSKMLLSIFDDGANGISNEGNGEKEKEIKYRRNKVFVITLSRPLSDKQRFNVLHQELFRMSWGNVMVYFQCLVSH